VSVKTGEVQFFIKIKMKDIAKKTKGIACNFYRISFNENEKRILFLEELGKRTIIKKSKFF